VQYLNNIIEQDQPAIKKRLNAKQGFRAFGAARRTIDGYEAVHMMRKGQSGGCPATKGPGPSEEPECFATQPKMQ
jgi:transposase-like protein